jgi:lipopolysaccharide transport system permease protein
MTLALPGGIRSAIGGRWYLLRLLVARDLAAKYKGAFLGRAWPLLVQIAQLLVFTYLFAYVFHARANVAGLPATAATFGIWLFAGLLPWNAFALAISQGAVAISGQPNLVKKVVFPLALLPLVPVASAFVESLFGVVPLVIVVALWTHHVHGTLLLLPAVMAIQLAFTAGLAYLVAALTAFVRDIPQALGPLILLGFYATPIVYSYAMVPAAIRPLERLNPMAAVAGGYRDAIFSGSLDMRGLLLSAIVSAIVAVAGFAVFKRTRGAFADVL